jgi:hypothetical protein
MSCRYYGMSGIAGDVLIPTGGNQCAMITWAHAPCQMELLGQDPDDYICPIAQREDQVIDLKQALLSELEEYEERHPQHYVAAVRMQDVMLKQNDSLIAAGHTIDACRQLVGLKP